MKTAIAYDESFLKHDTGLGHPETSGRLESILSNLVSLDPNKFQWQKNFLPAKTEDISRIHQLEYIQQVESSCNQYSKGYFDGDTPFSNDTFKAASLAAGAGIHLANLVLNGEIKNGFALVRPPGHHAESSHAMGFCLFNNIAITAKYLRSKGIQKILILDWDVHHGNGTQNQFYEDDSVYFVSFHQFPFYPGSGATNEIGTGIGKGYTMNIPLPRNSIESDYMKYWPSFQKEMEKFQPEVVLISAGFDAHREDPLGGMLLETSTFEKFTQLMLAEAKQYAKNRMISFLEGGYDFLALSDSVRAHLEVLASA